MSNDLKDQTAAELAHDLKALAGHQKLTGWLSMLDEATLAFRTLSLNLDGAHRAFSHARSRHQRSYSPGTGSYSDDSWAAVVTAAYHLALLLDELGDHRIARCKRDAGWGACNLPLAADGECHSTLGHKD